MADSKAYRILLVGYRAGLIQVLRKRHVPFALWDHRKRSIDDAFLLHCSPFKASLSDLKKQAKFLSRYGPFTHVLACSEGAVVPASIARTVLEARPLSHEVVLKCHDKVLMKDELSAHGVPMTPYLKLHGSLSTPKIVQELGLPVVLKDAKASGGRGVFFAYKKEEVDAHRSKRQLAERFIDGAEYSIESIVESGRIIFTNITDYYVKKHINLVPANLSPERSAKLLEFNRKVIELLEIPWGMTHLEVYDTKEGYLFGEIALRPPGGYIMELLSQAYAMNSWECFLALQLGEPLTFDAAPKRYACVNVLHPGQGRVVSIEGMRELKSLATLVKAKVKIREGDILDTRTGVGDDVGYYILASEQYDKLIADLNYAQTILRIKLH